MIKTASMKLSDKVSKEIFITILYGAILGNYISAPFSEAVDALISGRSGGMESQNAWRIIEKVAFTIGTGIFFCCEYIYALQNKNYKSYFLLSDFLNLIIGGLIFESIHYADYTTPDYVKISKCFTLIMANHFLWSVGHYLYWKYISTANNRAELVKHYSWVGTISFLLLVVYFFIFWVLYNGAFPELTILVPLSLFILLTDAAYIVVLFRRKYL